MQAVQAASFGGPEVLTTTDLPTPVAGPDEVVVEVAVADVLTIDTVLRSGQGREYFAIEPPFVPGTGVAGTVLSVGEGVDAAWIGRRVVALTGVTGGYVQQAVVPEQELITVPDELRLDRAAALINDGRTALALIEGSGVQPREQVLIMPAGSGLGLVLVQLARASGARVIAAARGARKLDLARESGAEVVVDYTQPGWAEQLRETTGGHGIDVVFDGIGGQVGRTAFETTARGGRFAGYGDAGGGLVAYSSDEPEQRGVRVLSPELVHIGGTEKAKYLAEQAMSLAAVGRIRPVIGQTFPLQEAADAHVALQDRTAVGRTQLLVHR